MFIYPSGKGVMDEKKNKTSKRFSRSFLWIIQRRRGRLS
jgi:hypothetical protein